MLCLDTATDPAGPRCVFRLTDWPTLIFATKLMVDRVKRLKLDGVLFREVEAR